MQRTPSGCGTWVVEGRRCALGCCVAGASERVDCCGRTCVALPASQDIYIARAEGELELEEELYWALINIYRSPGVMFELTRVQPRAGKKQD